MLLITLGVILFHGFLLCFPWFQVCIITPSLHVNFSPTIYGAVLGLLANLDVLHFKSVILLKENSLSTMSSTTQKAFHSSIIANLESVSFRINLESDKERNGCTLMFNLHKIDIRYVFLSILFFCM